MRAQPAEVLPDEQVSRELREFPSLHTSWALALLGRQSRNQDLARPPGKSGKGNGILGLLEPGLGMPYLGRSLWSGTFMDSKGGAKERDSFGNLVGVGG